MKPKLFKRNDIVQEDTGITMPYNKIDVRIHPLSIGELLTRYENFTKDYEGMLLTYPWATRFVMGFPLPSWQRDLVWTDEQKIKFITSIWEGVDLGSYLINDYEYTKDDKSLRENSDVLLDGQQRLSAIEAYITNKIAVPDSNGIPRYWSEIGRIQRRRFIQIPFAQGSVKTFDENELRRIYNLRSFGGTAHKESERA